MPKEDKPGFSARLIQLKSRMSAGKFAPCYLVFGPQGYLRVQNGEYIADTLLGDGDRSMNFTRFSGSEFTAKEVIDLAETLPFFAERRVIYLKDTGLWDKGMQSEAEALADYLGTQPETTSFVFCEESIDRKRALYKAIARSGEILECDTPEEEQLYKWTAKRFSDRGISIDRRTLAVFLGTVGDDLYNIDSEAEKLVSYCADKGSVTAEDIRAVTTRQVKDRIFEMIRAIGLGDRSRAASAYMELRAMDTPPQVILSLMVRQYTQLIQVLELDNRGAEVKAIASAIHAPGFAVQKEYLPMVRRVRMKDLEEALDRCAAADAGYKSGAYTDRLAVEILIAGQTLRG